MPPSSTPPNKGRQPLPPKDFLAVRSGRWSLHISPQTPRGWGLLFLWTLALIAPTVPLAIAGAWLDETPYEIWVLAGMVPVFLLTGLIIWLMVRWMLARADIITSADLAELKRNRSKRTR